MEVVKITLPRELTQLNILTIADTHTGDPGSDTKLLEDRVGYVERTPNVYAILNGDLANLAIVGSKSDPYRTTLNPQGQLDYLVKLLFPIRHKILFLNEGNHERRVDKNVGLTFTSMLATELGLKDRFSATGTLCFLRFGEYTSKGRTETNGSGKLRQACFTIYATHGARSGRKVGSKATSLLEIADNIDADIIIKSHSHHGMILPNSKIVVDPRNNAWRQRDQLLINTGAYLDFGGYGETGEFKPVSKATPELILESTGRSVAGQIKIFT